MSTPTRGAHAPLRGLMVFSQSWAMMLTSGVVLMLLGTLALYIPASAKAPIETVLGWLFIVGGLFHSLSAITRDQEHRVMALAVGILYILAGALLLAHPWQGIVMLALVLSVFFIVEGIFKLSYMFSLPKGPARNWVLFNGLLSLALGGLIWIAPPTAVLWVVWIIVAINFLLGGLATIMLSIALRDMQRGQTGSVGG